MKVWLVIRSDWDSSECVGVFSSEVLARAFIQAFPNREQYDVHEKTVDDPNAP